MEGFLYWAIAIICCILILLFFTSIVYSTYKKSDKRNIRVFHYKKIENLYEEFVLSNENEYLFLENKIRLCYIILILFIISIPVLFYLFFVVKESIVFRILDFSFVLVLLILGHFIITKELPSLLDRKNSIFKNGLIKYIIKENLNDFKYNSTKGIDPEEYISSNIYEKFDKYYSEDLIEGYIDGNKVSMAEVKTLMGEYDRFKTVFHGLFSVVTLKKKTEHDFIITSKKVSVSNRIIEETTSKEFNELYNIYTKNGVETKALFNKKTIDLLCDFAHLTNSMLDIKVKDKNIYFRFNIGPLFDGLIFSSDEKKRLYLFSLICQIIKNVNDSIKSIK